MRELERLVEVHELLFHFIKSLSLSLASKIHVSRSNFHENLRWFLKINIQGSIHEITVVIFSLSLSPNNGTVLYSFIVNTPCYTIKFIPIKWFLKHASLILKRRQMWYFEKGDAEMTHRMRDACKYALFRKWQGYGWF